MVENAIVDAAGFQTLNPMVCSAGASPTIQTLNVTWPAYKLKANDIAHVDITILGNSTELYLRSVAILYK
jgi:hypothetical protein